MNVAVLLDNGVSPADEGVRGLVHSRKGKVSSMLKSEPLLSDFPPAMLITTLSKSTLELILTVIVTRGGYDLVWCLQSISS